MKNNKLDVGERKFCSFPTPSSYNLIELERRVKQNGKLQKDFNLNNGFCNNWIS